MTTTLPKPVCKRGDVILVLFPHSDLRSAKLRPALVVQADDLQTGLPQLIVAMITSRLFRANHPSRVMVLRSSPEGQQSGLLTDSVVMTDNLATIAETEIDRVIGTLPMAEWHEDSSCTPAGSAADAVPVVALS
jgi:mRNA interferase MazF